MAALQPILSPQSFIEDDEGPMKLTPSCSHLAANSSFSDRKPYPGWTASAPEVRITSRITSWFRYDFAGAPSPMWYDSVACLTCRESRSSSEYTATVLTPSARQVRITRRAISPLFAISTFSIIPITD